MSNAWISVKERLPDVEANTIGFYCQVLCKDGSIYYALFVHDLEVDCEHEVDTKYFSGIETIKYHEYYDYNNEYYEIANVTHYCAMPEMPQP